MKKQICLIAFILVFIAEITFLIIFAMQSTNSEQNTVEVNEVIQSVLNDYGDIDAHKNHTSLDYVVLNNRNEVIYKTKSGLSESINRAIAHRDTIITLDDDGYITGTIIIYNKTEQQLYAQKKSIIIVIASATVLQIVLGAFYAFYLHTEIIKPFGKLKNFAVRVAGGNLDVPLEMDKRNLFGAFTESFDLMRTELKKARISEAQAQISKKELVAKLSHDIKTPVASIKAVSEVGFALSDTQKSKDNYSLIIRKADQINALVSNLFSATLEELERLTVSPDNIESCEIKTLLENADYLHRAKIPDVTECLVYADRLRLQQVFDNLFSNSYKYAGTDICVTTQKTDGRLLISIEDYGGGVSEQDLPVIKEKFKRGSNSSVAEGAGLGLYISDYFMKEMNGSLEIKNGEKGLKATVSLSLSGNI